MTTRLRSWWAPALGCAAVLMLLSPTSLPAAAGRRKAPKPGQYNPDHKTVEMFQAIKDGQIDVKLISKDSSQCGVLVENKTRQPLNVKLPEAFAGVPVLAQVGGAGVNNPGGWGGGGNNRNWGNNSGNQGFGGGMMGMGGMGMWNVPPEQVAANAPAMLNVPPEKVGKLKVDTVCLEHGKAEPRAAMKYEIKPIEQFTDKKEVHELCRMLGSGHLNQRAAQAAAWHLNNHMSWQELAAKRLEHANGTSRPYFSPQELQAGMQLAVVAARLAQQREKLDKTPSTATSLSSK